MLTRCESQQPVIAQSLSIKSTRKSIGEAKKYAMGRKIYLLPTATISNERSKAEPVELVGATEVKAQGVDIDVKIAQLKKNLCVNKNMLSDIQLCAQINAHEVIGIDLIGLQGFLYSMMCHDESVFAANLCDTDVFLPEDESNILDFMRSDSMDQLLYHVDNLISLKNSLKKGFKIHKRKLHNDKTTSQADTRLPPPATKRPTFLSGNILYPPKRENATKKVSKVKSSNSYFLTTCKC